MQHARPDLELLSPREKETLSLAAVGLTDKEIAVNLGVSLTTIRTYWERIREKLSSINRAQTVAIFVRGSSEEIPPVPDRPIGIEPVLQAAIDQTIGGILVLDPENKIIAANEKVYDMLNRPLGSIEGMAIGDVMDRRFHGIRDALESLGLNPDTQITVAGVLRVLAGPDLLVTVSIRGLDFSGQRYAVAFIQDQVADINARRRGLRDARGRTDMW